MKYNVSSLCEVDEILDKRDTNNNVIFKQIYSSLKFVFFLLYLICVVHLKVEYLVKWKKNGIDDDSEDEEWVPADLCTCPTSIAEYEKSIGVNLK